MSACVSTTWSLETVYVISQRRPISQCKKRQDITRFYPQPQWAIITQVAFSLTAKSFSFGSKFYIFISVRFWPLNRCFLFPVPSILFYYPPFKQHLTVSQNHFLIESITWREFHITKLIN